VVALLPATEAYAAKSGGRIGGTAQAQKPPPKAAPRPAVVNKTTVINKTVVVPPPAPSVVVAPPVTPFGMGMMAPAPVVVAPAPSLGDVIVGNVIGSAISNAIAPRVDRGPTGTDRMLENQMRQDERMMDRQANQIEDLQRELQDLKKK